MATWKRAFYTLFIAELLVIAGMQSVTPFLPYYVQDLGVEDLSAALIWAGRIGTVSGLAMAVSAPIWGYLADRIGRKPMVVRSMLGGALALVLAAYVRDPGELFWVRCLHGVLSGTVTACVALVATSTPRAQLGFALGGMQAVFMLGGTIGPYVGGELVERFGFRGTFLVASVCSLIGGLMVQAFVREEFRRDTASAGATGGAARPGLFRDTRRVLQIRPFRLLVIGSLVSQFSFALSMPVLPLFLQRLAGGGEVVATAGKIFGLAGLSGALASLALGRYAETLGFRIVLASSLVLSALIAVGQGFALNSLQLGGLVVAGGAAAGAVRPVINLIMTRCVSESDRGVAVGVIASASALGWGVGPILGGYMGAELGLRAVFWLMALLFGLLAAIFWTGIGRDASGVVPPQQLDQAEE